MILHANIEFRAVSQLLPFRSGDFTAPYNSVDFSASVSSLILQEKLSDNTDIFITYFSDKYLKESGGWRVESGVGVLDCEIRAIVHESFQIIEPRVKVSLLAPLSILYSVNTKACLSLSLLSKTAFFSALHSPNKVTEIRALINSQFQAVIPTNTLFPRILSKRYTP